VGFYVIIRVLTLCAQASAVSKPAVWLRLGGA